MWQLSMFEWNLHPRAGNVFCDLLDGKNSYSSSSVEYKLMIHLLFALSTSIHRSNWLAIRTCLYSSNCEGKDCSQNWKGVLVVSEWLIMEKINCIEVWQVSYLLAWGISLIQRTELVFIPRETVNHYTRKLVTNRIWLKISFLLLHNTFYCGFPSRFQM